MTTAELPSPYDTAEGIVYLPRMLAKIRMEAAGELPQVYQENLGIGFDGRCCAFLGVNYAALVEQVNGGADDSAAIAWAFAHGRKPTAEQVEIWNGFMTKRGWKDDATPQLDKRKRESSFADRGELETFFAYIDADEGRPAHR